jgi:2-dehydro-3-deoxyphosphogluconate aldolase/(4S)-4-hydroxy-2-oxoglutarate aldolase
MPNLPPILAVVTLHDLDDLPPLAAALHAGGIRAIELALRTPVALKAVTRLRALLPGALIGAGTVLTPEHLDQARDAGAHFTLAPGLNPRTLRRSLALRHPHIPGVATPGDIQAAVNLGARLLKFFPAKPLGGIPALATMNAPFAHLGLRYVPMGGITAAGIGAWLAGPVVASVGMSAIAPPALIQAGDWPQIQANAATAIANCAAATAALTAAPATAAAAAPATAAAAAPATAGQT